METPALNSVSESKKTISTITTKAPKDLGEVEINEIVNNVSFFDLYEWQKSSKDPEGLAKIQEIIKKKQDKIDEEKRELENSKLEQQAQNNENVKLLKELLELEDIDIEKAKADGIMELIFMVKENTDILDAIKRIKLEIDSLPETEGKRKEELEMELENKKSELVDYIKKNSLDLEKEKLKSRYSIVNSINGKKISNKDIEKLNTKWRTVTIDSSGKIIERHKEVIRTHNRISRRRLNKVIEELNSIPQNEPQKGINYVLRKTYLLRGGKIHGWWKWQKDWWALRRNPDYGTLKRRYKEQTDIYFQDLKNKLNKPLSDNDKRILKEIENKLDYFIEAYEPQC